MTRRKGRAWIEANARAKRNQTRTERNYYIGLRYLREKKGDGQRGPGKAGNKVASCSTADRIGAEERCSHQQVKTCAKFAAHVNEASAGGLAFLKWPILAE